MAESSSYHATNTTNSNKLSLAVDSIAARTTSETIRISSEAALPSSFILRPTAMTTTTPSNFQLPTSTTTNTTTLNESQISTRKKSTSFQITSVVSSHASNDGADDSADDMDDSHAEDGSDMGDNNSSKCAETPSASCSEDAYSKSEEGAGITPFIQVTPVANLNDSDAVFAASDYQLQQQIARTLSSVSPSALAPPVTPSSSSPSSNANNEGSKATFSEAEKDQQQWQTRFKVVKIESQEPFKRGRWLCMDFLDHPSLQTSLSRDESASNNSSNASSVHYVPGENPIAEHPLGHAAEEQNLPGVVPQQLLPQQQMTVPPLATVPTSIVVPQPMLQPNFLPNPTSTPLVHYPNPEPPNYTSQAAPPTYPVPPQQQIPNPTMAVPRPVGLPTANYPVSNTGAYIQTVYTPAPNSQIPPNYPTLVLQQPGVSNQPPNAVYPAGGGTTIPTQTHYAQGPSSLPAAQAQGMYPSTAQQHFVNPAAAAVAPAPVVQPQAASAPTYQQPQQPYPAQTAFAPAQSSPATFAAYGAQPTAPANYAGPTVAQQYQSVPPNPSAGSTYAQPNTQVYSAPQPTAQQPYVPPPSAAPSYATAVASTPVQAQFVVPAPTPAPQATVSLVTGQPAVSANPEAGAATASKIVLPVVTAPAPQTQPLLLGSGTSTSTSSVTSTNTAGPPTAAHAHFASLLPANMMGDEGTTTSGDDPNSTAGSTVAIDNKIEQAMDLVKSHLMYAVREEVEVLKERIAELLDRISVLETENSILKAAAPQEVLAELSTEIEDQHYSQQSSPAPPPQGPPSSTNN